MQGGKAAFFAVALVLATRGSPAADYYIDSVDGSDANPGTSEDQAWQTLDRVHGQTFAPGDAVRFKRGCSWEGGLVIDDSGEQGNPILFSTYGSGDRPVLRNPGVQWGRALTLRSDYVVVEGFLLTDAHEAGVLIENGADFNTVRDCEATGVGIGFAVRGQNNLITRNHAHDLLMVVNTDGGDDDYGAVGVWLFNSGNQVSYNRMIRCIAPSHDYGVDGGVVEFYGDVHNCSVHHNWGEECDGGLEVGGGSAYDNLMAYNILVNNGGIGGFHLGGGFGSDVRNFRFENNTIVETGGTELRYVVVWFNQGDPAADTFLMRNNIVYVDKFRYVADKTGFTHDHNLYTLPDPASQLGFPPGAGESVADPLFVDPAGPDFHLQSGSPAVDAGADLGHTLDFDDRPVPAGAAPDIGAYERPVSDTIPPAAPQNLQVQPP